MSLSMMLSSQLVILHETLLTAMLDVVFNFNKLKHQELSAPLCYRCMVWFSTVSYCSSPSSLIAVNCYKRVLASTRSLSESRRRQPVRMRASMAHSMGHWKRKSKRDIVGILRTQILSYLQIYLYVRVRLLPACLLL